MGRVVWRQFLLACAIVALYYTISQYHSELAHSSTSYGQGEIFVSLLWQLPRRILWSLAFGVGVALSLLPNAAGAFRVAAIMVGVVTGVLVVDDLAGKPVWEVIDSRGMGMAADDGRPLRFNDTTTAIGGTIAHLLGRVRPQDIQPWPPRPSTSDGFKTIDDPVRIIRISAVPKYSAVLGMLKPWLVAGIVAGLGVWLQRIATFKSVRDERLLRLVLGWFVTIVVVVGVGSQRVNSLYILSSPSVSLAWMLVPYLIAAVPAFLGWRALWRLDRLAGE